MLQTERLDLHRPSLADLPELHALYSDPRVWTHFPSLRHTVIDQTRSMLERWMHDWDTDGLGNWIVRERDRPELVGHCGCAVRDGAWWNLGYRFSPSVHGRGYASEAARAAVEEARRLRPELPVVAYLLEHNEASARVAQKVGLDLRHRAPDTGNPDPDAIRLVFADRPLDDTSLNHVLG
jgi:RimJ/RimL family protein N-acetyltransferase